MDNQTVIKKLSSLVHLDIDAIHAYDQAIQKIDVMEVRSQLDQFKADHQRHVDDLSAVIRRLGGEPPTFSPDFKGYLIQGFTALRSVTGTEGALKAMDTNEKLTNRNYESALSWDLASDVMDIIRRNREDERRHLAYVEEQIRNQAWKRAA